MSTDLAVQLRQALMAVPYCPDPQLTLDKNMLAELGFNAGRYALAQELMQLLAEHETRIKVVVADPEVILEVDLRAVLTDRLSA